MSLPRTPVTAAVVTLLALGLPALAASTAAALPAHPAAVQRVAPSPATITVTGEGGASAEPDLAVVGAGVETVAETPQRALDAQTRAADALLKAVRRQGVADRDIRTEHVSLNPVYDHTDGTARLKGYQAAQSFSLKVREVKKTGTVLQAITDATGEAGRVTSVAFDVSDPVPLQARARQDAHDDAHAKALQYARLSGHRLGRLVSLSEDTAGHPRPVPQATDATGSGVPVAPGVIRATATVTAVYELD
jgi:uncharacterized protein YggE